MQNLRITKRKLTDGSEVFAVQFEAMHADCKRCTVTLECESEVAAAQVEEHLAASVSYAETDLR